jgi:Arc/MetJ family transcription regulator
MHMSMRTTLDIDDALLARAQAQFPPGTPKTVLVEEGLRRLIAWRALAVVPAPVARRDARMQRLVDEGHVTAATSGAPVLPREGIAGGVPLAQLIADLAQDRDDR